MTLTRWQRPEAWSWSPLFQLSSLRNEIDRLFEAPFTPGEEKQPFFTGWGPPIDLSEDKDHVYVRAEVPGMKKEEIEISLHDGTLTLSGERKEKEQQEGVVAIRTERFVGRFSRSFTLSSPVNSEKVKATYRDGILSVVLPKAEESKPKQIQIRGE
jgi:HSP20 family protein